MAKKRDSDAIEDTRAPAFVEPVLDAMRQRDINIAAGLHVEANRSDPFARGRVMLHMRRGIALPSEVRADAESALAARRAAKG